ncbi:hypothetical protein J2W30_004650 [Variovorax boronicumulans]|uniref:hypothetical protein n=1 Tax=Variovorax boronicumulans TaxID=436515 RepID=UPI002787E9F5|nr:hypothetical protein [Variovorax boronicumulans]MDQ0036875.1 hypothetical protein [Variovorax boronicumulans]
MPSDTFSAPPPTATNYLQSMTDWQAAVDRKLWLIGRQRWEAMAARQRSNGAVQRELMDQRICRFGGAVPLDG